MKTTERGLISTHSVIFTSDTTYGAQSSLRCLCINHYMAISIQRSSKGALNQLLILGDVVIVFKIHEQHCQLEKSNGGISKISFSSYI